ncbi:hypothetical protein AGMMS49965_26070 [Bacteroidia bacterium]|nr:hypothetical protein AGMMS49965_26070 [Bacteroidia bacterium]
MNEFDLLAGHVFSTVTDLMGENAVWHKSNKIQVEGKVLFKNPTEPLEIGDTERWNYRPTTATLEYYEGTFDGLKQVVDKKRTAFLTVRGQKYTVAEVTTKFDGKTFIAHIEPYKKDEIE